MINLDNELSRLRFHLVNRGLQDSEADEILALAKQDMDRTIEVHMKSAINEAKDAGLEKISPHFLLRRFAEAAA